VRLLYSIPPELLSAEVVTKVRNYDFDNKPDSCSSSQWLWVNLERIEERKHVSRKEEPKSTIASTPTIAKRGKSVKALTTDTIIQLQHYNDRAH